ncbi:MAG: YqgE/AlgH family protein [Chitinivibrionales bacterium]|nr:YqgE/AlgH family protein [Chitinivibrionales bacterium]
MVMPQSGEFLHEEKNKHLKRLKGGSVLLSREALQDPNFAQTVVLICAHNGEGAFGLVLNRPSHMPLSEVFNIDLPNRQQRRKIYIGGPVQQEALQVLQTSGESVGSAHEIADGIHFGGEWHSLEQILNADESSTRLFLGYSGWAGGQLENEILQNAWDVYNVDLRALFDNAEHNLFGDVDQIRNYLVSLSV